MRDHLPYQIYWDEMNEVEDEQDDTLPEKLDIICINCRDRVGYIVTAEIEAPLRGDMFHPHRGCENWPMPNKWMGPQELVCPHAAGEDGDKHLFIRLNNNEPDRSYLLMTSDHKLFDIRKIIGECPCGCGQLVSPGNKYADGLRCHNRMRQTEK